jgi:3-oxoacyl-(acyl-carrier-protein) synthase
LAYFCKKSSALQKPISITAIASVSPLGRTEESVWANYLNPSPVFTEKAFGNHKVLVASLNENAEKLISDLRQSDTRYKALDRSVLLAMAASRAAVKKAGWNNGKFGINIGSSRGATELFEQHHQDFLNSGTAKTLASPTTTLGNISSWVSHDLQSDGPEVSHSITCSTALHALLNGVAWLRAGMADKFLVGGSEAPLTGFTIAQMQAMKIYAKNQAGFPCRALDLEKKQNTMILGEAASVCCLEIGAENALAVIESVGYATEILEHSVSISAEADCFQKSMAMALQNVPLSEVDAIVMHAPGTIAGDLSEYKAIQAIFGESLPMLTTNKWKTGHTFGASGMLSIELAVMMLQHQQFIGVPFAQAQPSRKALRKILVNAVGFGGNAVSVLLTKP